MVSACAAGYTEQANGPGYTKQANGQRCCGDVAMNLQMPRLTPRTLWATERYERISSELRPRSFGLPLSPTPLEAPTPTPLSISGLQSDGGALQIKPATCSGVRKTGQSLQPQVVRLPVSGST